jgi:membrane protease YdiL (CAAX protease family)
VSTDPPLPKRSITVATLIVAMSLPTVLAYLYFVVLGGSGRPNALQQAAYASGKTLQFAIPILFFALVVRRMPTWRRPNGEGLLLGLGFGLLVGAIIIGVYYGGLHSSKMLAQSPARIRQKLDEFGIGSPLEFVALGLFIAVVHSFLEEYYWRWFVFGRLRTLMPMGPAIVLSSLGFMSHHVIVIAAYLPDRFWTGVVPASLAVAIGGAAWAWLYHKAGSLIAPWVSHALIDGALFVIGWDLMRR